MRRRGHRRWTPRRCLAAGLASGVCALGAVDVAQAMSSTDILGTKVWLDQHLFNMTLKTTRTADGGKVWLMNEEKARDNGLEWPVASWPTLCFLGVGPSSIEYLAALAQLFPQLQLALIDVQDQAWLDKLAETLSDAITRVSLAKVDEFAEDRGVDRRTCHAISWSVDTPPFSFYKYRELFYSSPYVLALFNMQGCTHDTRHERTDEYDKYYCEYLHSAFRSTLCGKVGENKSAGTYNGQELYFPQVDTGCGDLICMCHAHSDAFLDFHFEHLCRKGQPEHMHRFMGQWGQDEFLYRNFFSKDPKRGRGVYVDVGASHPYHLSNTAYFDSCMGWRGVCMEPNPRSNSVLRAMRGCEVVSACAWSKRATLRFQNGGELAAMTDDQTLLPSDPFTTSSNSSAADTFFEARCAPLHDLLLEGMSAMMRSKGPESITWSGPDNARPVIDLMSVDAEGAEIEIFKDFPFEAWDIRAIVVEVSRRSSMALDSLLLPAGFVRIAVLGKDAIYTSRELASKLPPKGLRLPEKIQWNEPGTDEDTIDYIRFQRYFGVIGDLDDEVGDQRLHNETELERQINRTSARHRENVQRLLDAAQGVAFGGVLSETERKAMELPEVQELLKDVQVKAALTALSDDEDTFRRELAASPRLRSKIARLHRVGAVSHPAVADAAAAEEAERSSLGGPG